MDLRERNSWRMLMAEVSSVELLEVQLVNAVAPFILNARLKPLMLRTPERDKHIVNVSAVEGQFYRKFKTTRHPHTNMAKAALNMMTRTSAADYHGDGIHMNSVDTGWVTDEDPGGDRRPEGRRAPLSSAARHRGRRGAHRRSDHRRDQHGRACVGTVPEGLPADGLVARHEREQVSRRDAIEDRRHHITFGYPFFGASLADTSSRGRGRSSWCGRPPDRRRQRSLHRRRPTPAGFSRSAMRDGVRLNTSVCEPSGAHDSAAIILTRTPYGIAGDTVVGEDYRFLAADGYVFVYQDIRGRFGSEGQFIMNRPLHDPADSAGVDESTDAYDTVEWLVHNIPNNTGSVGVMGVSYPGFLATMAGINPHPAVKAVSPQAPMTDTWMGDDFFHQGAFRLSYGFEYTGSLELSSDMSQAASDRDVGHLRLVSPARAALERRCEVLPREGADVGGVRRTSRVTTSTGRRARCSAG